MQFETRVSVVSNMKINLKVQDQASMHDLYVGMGLIAGYDTLFLFYEAVLA